MTSPGLMGRRKPVSIAPSRLTLTVETVSEKTRPLASIPKMRTERVTFFRCSRRVAMNANAFYNGHDLGADTLRA
jgi:hypothetical protein